MKRFQKNNNNNTRTFTTRLGFTIVELLIVVVVIGILAAITIVSFGGITNSANTASVQSDLNSNSKKVLLYFTKYGTYPTKFNDSNCPTLPIPDNDYCLKTSGNNALSYNTYSSGYFLSSSSPSSETFSVSNNQSPTAITSNITALTPSTVNAGSYIDAVVISPDGTSAYATNNSNTIYQYNRNTSTGVLTPMASPTVVTSGEYIYGIIISPDGKNVYATNSRNVSSSNCIYMFSRNTATGALTALGTPILATGEFPGQITISPDGGSVYVILSGTVKAISMFSRNASTGALSALATPNITAGSSPTELAISPDGNNLYVTDSGLIYMFSRNSSTSALTPLGTPTIAIGSSPTGIVVSPDGKFVYANAGFSTNPRIYMYSRNTTTGSLTALTIPYISTGQYPFGIAASPDGASIYVAVGGGATEGVHSYKRNISTGLLSPASTPSVLATSGSSPYLLTVSPDGKHLYVTNNGSNYVSMFSRN